MGKNENYLLAGKHDIAVNILLYCLEHYEKNILNAF